MKTKTSQRLASASEIYNSFLNDLELILRDKVIVNGFGMSHVENTVEERRDRTITSLYGICTKRIWFLIGKLERQLSVHGIKVSSAPASLMQATIRLFAIQPNIFVKIVVCRVEEHKNPEFAVSKNPLYVVQIEMEALEPCF